MTGTADEKPFVVCGRCASGRRWFWYAEAPYGESCDCGGPACQRYGRHAHGWEDTEAAAVEAMSDACAQLGGDRPPTGQGAFKWSNHHERRDRHERSHTHVQAGWASDALKRINAAKRAAKPPTGDTSTHGVEYLYGTHISWSDYYDSETTREVVPFQITKKTAKRIYYIRLESWERRRAERGGPVEPLKIGYIDRAKFETAEERANGLSTGPGEIYSGHRGDDSHLFATREAAEADLFRYDREREQEREQAVPRLKALKAAMAAAHPDRGGTDAEFIAARKAYQQALRSGRSASTH